MSDRAEHHGADDTAGPVAPVEVDGLRPAAELLRALANPHRVAIVLALAERDLCVHELVDALDASQPLVSQHLRVLREVHLVEGRRRGREIAYGLTDRHVAHIVGDAVVHAAEPPPGDR